MTRQDASPAGSGSADAAAFLADPAAGQAAAEDALVGRDWVPAHAEIEYHQPILPGCEPWLVTSRSPGQLEVWLMAETGLLASVRLAPAAVPG